MITKYSQSEYKVIINIIQIYNKIVCFLPLFLVEKVIKKKLC